MGITRRDFLNGVAITIAAGLTPMQILRASPQTANQTLYYPPTLTGLRGNHPGSFEHAHQLGRDGKAFDFASSTGHRRVRFGGGRCRYQRLGRGLFLAANERSAAAYFADRQP